MVQPNLGLGIGFHATGALMASNCYAPQKYAKGWSWETFWVTQAAWCWLLWPIIGALITIPHLGQVLQESPHDVMFYAFLMGIAYGVGGTAFNISIRYIGFSLTYSIAVGLSSILGTLAPPLMRLDGLIGGASSLAPMLIVNVIRMLLPQLEALGIATAEEVSIDTLEERVRLELATTGSIMQGSLFIGAWSRLQG